MERGRVWPAIWRSGDAERAEQAASRTSAVHLYKHENSATQQIRRREPGSLPPGQSLAWARWRWCRAGRKLEQAIDYAAALLSSTPWPAGCMELTWRSRILASEVRSLTQLPCAGSALAKAAAIRSR